MKVKNTENATIRYYTGLIRDLEARIKELNTRVEKLENQVKKIPQSNPTAPSNLDLFSDLQMDKGVAPTGSVSGGGFSASEIKAMVAQWINNGQLPIPLHDHTDTAKGGDSFAGKGAKLQ